MTDPEEALNKIDDRNVRTDAMSDPAYTEEDLREAEAFCEKNSVDTIVAPWLAAEFAKLRCDAEKLAKAANEAANWLEKRPDYTEGDAATASKLRAALAEHERRK